MTNLFVYGALMYDEVWERIVSGKFRKTSGQLQGYRRLAVKDEEYPGLVKGDGSVKGCIWYGLDDEALAKLDIFEGEYYQRIPLSVVDHDANLVKAHVYLFKPEYRDLLEAVEWDREKFERSGLNKFVKRHMEHDN